MVALEDGTTGLPDKTQYTSHNTNNSQSDSTFERDSGNFPNDTPSAGYVIVIDTSANEEHMYRYTSWSGTVLTLATEVTGAADTGTSGTTLHDTGNFATGVQKGDIIRNITDSNSWCYVVSVDSNDQVTTTVLSSGNGWDVADSYEINSLVVTYDNTDKFYIPYLMGIEDNGTDAAPGSMTDTLTAVSDRAVVIRVRNVEESLYEIIPFVTTSDIDDETGMSVAVIRNVDEVYS
jgi:hypothetical protein